MINGKKFYMNASFYYVFIKKHYCPCCGTRLSTQNDSVIINSGPSEAKKYDFSIADTYMMGNIKFTTKKFVCKNCNFEASIEELKSIEKKNKK